MKPEAFYNRRIIELKAKLNKLNKRKSLLAWLRLATIIAIFLSWYFLNSQGLIYVVISVLLLAVIFTRFIYIDINNKSLIENTTALVSINEAELKALAHDYYHFPDGNEFVPKEHSYANDLDIFGHASLYQLINRTNSEMGNTTLADWLTNPANREIVLLRQESIKELKEMNDWRQNLQALGTTKKIQLATKTRLQEWFNEKDIFINNKALLILQYVLPMFIITVIILNITDVLSNYTRNYCLFFTALVAFYIYKKVTLNNR